MCEMSLSVAEEGHEDQTGGSFPAVDLCIDSAQLSLQNMTLELLVPETS